LNSKLTTSKESGWRGRNSAQATDSFSIFCFEAELPSRLVRVQTAERALQLLIKI
jgi:hypothetical protein